VMPNLERVIETALYVDDLERAADFYLNVLGLRRLFRDNRLQAFSVGGKNVLLLFQRGASLETTRMPGGTIPPHDGRGPLHVAFAIAAEELPAWEARLLRHEIAIEGRTEWPRGGYSIYFRDPDGHLLEFATPGLWEIY
jgi:catechol 2,3-dioxygenase-like lactoylglutathione lyase family enzyme